MWAAITPGIIFYNGALYLSLMTWVTKLSDMATRALFETEMFYIDSTFYVLVDILNTDIYFFFFQHFSLWHIGFTSGPLYQKVKTKDAKSPPSQMFVCL